MLDHDVDRLVVQPRQVVGLPVVAVPRREALVERLLHHRVGLHRDVVDERCTQGAHGRQHLLAFLGRAVVHRKLAHDRRSVGGAQHGGHRRQLVRGRSGELRVHLEEGVSLGSRVEDQAGVELADRLQPVVEPGHDAEVAATTADGPEQVRVLLGARGQGLARRRDDFG